MNFEEVRAQGKEIKLNAEESMRRVGREYCDSQLIAKVGDTVTARHANGMTIRITNIKYVLDGFVERLTEPEAVYYGEVLTKKGVPRKDGERALIFQRDIVEVNRF